MNDLVVVLPGIMGSALYRDEQALWDPTIGGLVHALKTLGGSIQGLALPPGIGDNSPEDGVYARHLLKDVHVIPGVWTPVRGYTELIKRLRRVGFTEETGNLLALPYDWRTSIRCIVNEVTPRIDAALDQWRTSDPARADAQIVFVAHSMGGLVARSYTTTHRDEVRKIITMGTPSRGSVTALQRLTQGIGVRFGRLRDQTCSLIGTLPSVHHLLPSYACIDTGDGYGDFSFLDANHPVTGLDTTMAAHGIGFLNDLAVAEGGDPGSAHRLHPLIGWKQPTPQSIRLYHGDPIFQKEYGGLEITGDGTVPLAGAIPKGMALDSPIFHGFVEQHGSLQSNPAVLNEIIRILKNAPPIVLKGDAVPISVDFSELLLEGDDLVVTIALPPDIRDAVAVVVTSEKGRTEKRPQTSEGRGNAIFRDLPPGVYSVTVRGVASGSALTPVTGTVVMWGKSWSE